MIATPAMGPMIAPTIQWLFGEGLSLSSSLLSSSSLSLLSLLSLLEVSNVRTVVTIAVVVVGGEVLAVSVSVVVVDSTYREK